MVLFTDMVGSTALASSLAPDTADELRRGHFAILRQAVAEAGGTEVKNLGDGLMVVFGAASAALSCAVAMQQGVERDNRGREHSVGLRVGLSGGEVSHEDDDYFGDPVIEAARLCARCASGQVLAADIVRLTAGRRSRHECRSLGELTLKGLPDPVKTVEVLWEPLGRADTGIGVPLPGRLAVRPASVSWAGKPAGVAVGCVQACRRGRGPRGVADLGEAGLGKTTLVAEAARAAFDEAPACCSGTARRISRPLSALRRSARPLRDPRPRGTARLPRGLHGPELARLVPALPAGCRGSGRRRSSDADAERYQLFAAVVGLVSRCRGTSRSWWCWTTSSGRTTGVCRCSDT